MAEQIGRALTTTSAPQCNAPSTNAWAGIDLTALRNLPERLNDDQLALVHRIAALPVPPMVPVDEKHFTRCMRMLTVLPSRADDALTAELRIALYQRHFGSYPAEAWSFLTERATLKCKWFPSPQECQSILDEWNRTDGPWRAHQLAQLRARQETQTRFDELVGQLKEGKVTQEQVDALPERWKRILATQGFLWDGTYALREWRVTPQEGESQGGQSPAGDQHHEAGTGEKARRPDEGTGA